eukprot:gene10531-11641_t
MAGQWQSSTFVAVRGGIELGLGYVGWAFGGHQTLSRVPSEKKKEFLIMPTPPSPSVVAEDKDDAAVGLHLKKLKSEEFRDIEVVSPLVGDESVSNEIETDSLYEEARETNEDNCNLLETTDFDMGRVSASVKSNDLVANSESVSFKLDPLSNYIFELMEKDGISPANEDYTAFCLVDFAEEHGKLKVKHRCWKHFPNSYPCQCQMEYVKSNADSSLENKIRHDNQQTALAEANIGEEYCVQAETSSITRETLMVIEDDMKSSGQVINQNAYPKRMLSSSEVVDTIWKGCNVGYIEGKIDGVCISNNRLLELRGQGFISDKIIDAYLLLLSQKYSNTNHKTLVLACCIMTEICHRLCYKPKLTKMLKPKERQIMFLNPMGEHNYVLKSKGESQTSKLTKN